MDRKETAGSNSGFANEREIGAGTARTLGGPTGREAAQSVATPRSTGTGAHDAGSGANETIDGLSGAEAMTRREAEDVAPGIADVDPDAEDADADTDETPVFDRAEEEHL
jgi:hypothetical protein